MTIARIRLDGKWVNLYANEIDGRLKKSENLSDLTDVALARENLELVGDIDTHNHDSIYLPLIRTLSNTSVENIGSIEKEKEERIAEDTRIEGKFDTEIQNLSLELSELQEKAVNDIENLEANLQNMQGDLEVNLQNIQSNLSTIKMTASKAAEDKFVFNTTTTYNNDGSSYSTTVTKSYYDTQNGIAAGSYSLNEILQKLVTLAHKHEITTTSKTTQCETSSCH